MAREVSDSIGYKGDSDSKELDVAMDHTSCLSLLKPYAILVLPGLSEELGIRT